MAAQSEMEERESAIDDEEEEEEDQVVWSRETVVRVLKIVSPRLPQRDLISLLFLTPWLHRSLTSYPFLWLVLDLHEMSNAGDRLVSALSLPRYRHVKQINLEFAQDIEDRHFNILKVKSWDSLQNLECLNLNGCQKISDKGIEAITTVCPKLTVFSIYWNVRVTDTGIGHLVKNCKHVVDLNLSGCKNISDKSLQAVADNYQELESLNITSDQDEVLENIVTRKIEGNGNSAHSEHSSFSFGQRSQDHSPQKEFYLSRLACNPCLAKYSTFGGLNSPLHFAAAKGHNEIVALLLENGADVNSRNYCGQTALMQACRYGHWEVVQTLLIFRCNVTRADYLSGRTALHFAAVNGHVRCIRLVVADFVASAPFESLTAQANSDRSEVCNTKNKLDQSALAKFVNKAADGGITALHMAALNGYFDCVQLLLDLHANVSAVTFHYGTSMDLIGAGSTPLHYAACGGNLKCCQILLARSSSRLTLNCNGWLPLDVARMWGRHWLEPLLAINSDSAIPAFPPSNYLSLPLMSVLNIARVCGLQSSATCSDETEVCAVCLERACTVAAEGCGHELCVRCALYLCSTSNIPSELLGPPGSIPCPLCRHGIISFTKLPGSPAKEIKLHMSLSLCTPCMLHPREAGHSTPACTPEIRKNRVASVSSELFCPVTCSPFPSVALPLCTCNDGPCPSFEPREVETQDGSSPSQSPITDHDKMEGVRLERVSCSSMFWGRRSCSRENQCNSEINA